MQRDGQTHYTPTNTGASLQLHADTAIVIEEDTGGDYGVIQERNIDTQQTADAHLDNQQTAEDHLVKHQARGTHSDQVIHPKFCDAALKSSTNEANNINSVLGSYTSICTNYSKPFSQNSSLSCDTCPSINVLQKINCAGSNPLSKNINFQQTKTSSSHSTTYSLSRANLLSSIRQQQLSTIKQGNLLPKHQKRCFFCFKKLYRTKHPKYTLELPKGNLHDYEIGKSRINHHYPQVQISRNLSIKQRPRPTRHSLLTRHNLLRAVFLISFFSCIWKLTHNEETSATYPNQLNDLISHPNQSNDSIPRHIQTNDTIPQNNQPTHSIPQHSEAYDSLPQQYHPNDSLTKNNQPNNSIPHHKQANGSVPHHNQPFNSIPKHSEPNESLYHQNQPNEAIPKHTKAYDSIPKHNRPNRSIPQRNNSSHPENFSDSNYRKGEDDKNLLRQKRQTLAKISSMMLPDPTNSACHNNPINEFPDDFMPDETKAQGGFIVHIVVVVYIIAAIADICLNYFVPALENICEALSLQADVSGATFMAVGTSAPEMATHFVSLFFANDDFGIGTVVGSAIFNLLVVISCCGIFGGMTTQLSWFPLTRDTIFYIIAILELVAFIEDGDIHLWESIAMVLTYIPYIVFMVFNRKIEQKLHYYIPDEATNLQQRYKIKMIQARSLHFFQRGNKDVATMKSTRNELLKLGLSNDEAVGFLYVVGGPPPSVGPSNVSSSEWDSAISDPVTHRHRFRGVYTGSVSQSSPAGSRKSSLSNRTLWSVNTADFGLKVSFKGTQQTIPEEKRRTFYDAVLNVIAVILRKPKTEVSPVASDKPSTSVSRIKVNDTKVNSPGVNRSDVIRPEVNTSGSHSEGTPSSPSSVESRRRGENKSTNNFPGEQQKDPPQTKDKFDLECVESPTRFQRQMKESKPVLTNLSSGSDVHQSVLSSNPPSRDPDIAALRRWSLDRRLEAETLQEILLKRKNRRSREQRRKQRRQSQRRLSCCQSCLCLARRRSTPDLKTPASSLSVNTSSLPASSWSTEDRESGKLFKIAEWIYRSPNKMVNNIFKKPKTRCKKFIWIIRFPILLLHYLTLPKPYYSRITGDTSSSKLYIVSFCLSILYLGVYSYIILWMSTIAGFYMKVPDTVIGVTVLATGTSVPNLLSSVLVAKSGYGDMAVSNVIGSNVFDILLGLGLPWTAFNLVHKSSFKNYSGTNSGLVVGVTLSTVVIYIWGSLHVMNWRVTAHYGYVTILVYCFVVGFIIYYEWGSFSCFSG